MNEAESSKLGSNLGQLLFFTGLILVYGFGSFWLCWELITDGKFAESGDAKDKIPVYIRFGIPILITGIGVLFSPCCFKGLRPPRQTNTPTFKFEIDDQPNLIIVTAHSVPGKNITKPLGLVRGNTIRARHLGKDIIASLRNIVGGEVTEYAKLLAESREQALDRMEAQAKELGANAIVGLQFQTSVIMGGAAEMMAYGTAVVVE